MDIVTAKRAIKGDKNAFGVLIKEVQDQAYKIAFCYLSNEPDAMDCVCSSIEKAFINIRKLRKPQFFKTWFIRIVINECKSELKRKKRYIEYSDELIDTSVEDLSDNIDLKMLVEELPHTERAIVYMKFFSGYTLDEISEIMSMPPGTVRSKLYRTLKSFRKELSNA